MSQSPGALLAPPTPWVVQPAADALVHALVDEVLARLPEAATFRAQLHDATGIRLVDILDHVVVPSERLTRDDLETAGFTVRVDDGLVAVHERGLFPDVLVQAGARPTLAMQVESVADFCAAHQLEVAIEGAPGGTYRRAVAWANAQGAVLIVERHGHEGFPVPEHTAEQLLDAQRHLEAFRRRRRHFGDIGAGFDHTDALVRAAVDALGPHWSCALFLRAEREYWERRNHAARVQKARQDALGLGWCNDDHHTYDASREWFHRTIAVLEALGFRCRERFYAGAEAGWGSQILEQPVLGTVIFADIDLAPDELEGDFAHAPGMRPLPTLRRAGLWCALHGESMLEAGINHLECTYDQRALRAQLEAAGVRMMAPFSNFPHLYQELTEGEWWPVRPERIEALLAAGHIDADAARDFRERGAIGSHLENLERNFGYKGFNQPGISEVLRVIDPREFVPSPS
ncbi:MAG TPA: hypothetical protein PKE51_00985 [Gemmatimonadaceae bacterium]|nr:hypothetical protein [Gemmatimonadaceae bacterium]